jgi:hypothetical protein
MASFAKGQIDGLAANMLNTDSSIADEGVGFRRDHQWVRQAFIVPYSEDGRSGRRKPMLEDIDIRNRKYSSASFKYTDSSLGGNHCINPPPQFTRYADIRTPGMLPDAREVSVPYAAGSTGMGRYYSEAIDDHNQIIHLRFGVPSYNSLTQFFTGFYNSTASQLARTGRVDESFFEAFSKFAVKVITIAVLPLTIIPMLFIMAGSAVRFLLRMPSSKFYYLKPTMAVYWHAVTSMVNQLSVNKRLVTYTQSEVYESFVGEKARIDNTQKTIYHQIFPELEANGMIDIYQIANRSKRLEMRHRAQLFKQLLQKGDAGWYGKVKKVYDEKLGLGQADPKESMPFSLKTFMEKWMSAKELAKGSSEGSVERDIRKGPEIKEGSSPDDAKKALSSKYEPNMSGKFWDYFEANAADGSEWASFRVDYTGPVSESFSNSSAPSSLAQKLNSASSGARDLKINLAGGNIDPLGIVSSVLSGVGSVMSAAADVLHISGLAAFAGNAFVDIPDHWESATASLPKSTYTMTLISPYGNPVSQMFSIYIPLCMLLAGCLPLAAGKQSWQSPFLCELYDRGRSICRLGMIESLSITRGVSNLGFNDEGDAMAVDVSFSIKDFSSVVAMPIQQKVSINPLEGIFDSENSFTDLLMVYSSISLRDANDRLPILRRQIDTKIANISSYFSASRLAMDLGSMSPGKLFGLFLAGTDKK